jgi:DNA-binding transcriptional ArsR family regulator
MTTQTAPQATVQSVLHALTDPLRLAIFAGLCSAESSNCSAFLQIDQKAIPKSTLSQHFKVLREAGLIVSEKRGVEVINRIDCTRFPPKVRTMVQAILEAHAAQMACPHKA